MAEYIVDTTVTGCDGYCPARERVVRCRDCKHAEDMTKLHDSWFCKRNVCAKPPIEPDGFCSWAELKVVE